MDVYGNLYIVDTGNHRIRRVDANGIITTVVGNSNAYADWGGYSGDGVPAVEAQINSPRDVAVDGKGNLYIPDTYNNRIRKVDTDGIITTVAGNGTQGFSGDGGPAISAQLNLPHSVAVDGAGNLYISDHGNDRIRMIDRDGNITTVAGTGSAGFSGEGELATDVQINHPADIILDGSGNLYIADFGNHRVRKVDSDNKITTVAGSDYVGYAGDEGAATSAQLNYPQGVALDGAGNLYIADYSNKRLRKVDSGGTITTVAGNGSKGYSDDGGAAMAAQLYYPAGVAVDRLGNLYIASLDNQRIHKVDSSGIITTVAGNGSIGYSDDGGLATAARLNYPLYLGLDGTGNLYFADSDNNRIRKVDSNGVITTVAGTGSRGFSGDGGAATSAQLDIPAGVALDGSGNLYIADHDNHRIRKVAPNGIITTVAGTGSGGYSGDGGMATVAELFYPKGLAADKAGNLYIADSYNNRVRKVDTNGIITTVAGNGGVGAGSGGFSGDGGIATNAQLDYPNDVTVDVWGNLYIVDYVNHRIRKVDANGIITTVAGYGAVGYGSGGYAGDGGAATSAHLNYPRGVAVDRAGNLYIADSGNHRIRKVNLGISLPPSPGINPNGGNYSTAQTLTINNIAYGYTAYYTLDGTVPTLRSQPYTEPFTLDHSATITAAVYDPETELWSTPATANIIIVPDGGTIHGTVTLTGRSNYAGATVTLEGTNFSTVTDSQGNYQFNNVPAGIYNIRVRMPMYLSIIKTNVALQSGQNQTVNLSPIPGDVKADAGNSIDIYDLTVVAVAFNGKPGTVNWNINADINLDNVIDIYDLVLVATNFGQQRQ